MDCRIYIVGGITFVSGLIGGFGAYLADTTPPESPAQRNALVRFLVLGVIAAACVPLFLSLVESKIIGQIFEAGAPKYEAYLIFVGLCLVAAFSSRAFITSVSNRLLQEQVEQATQVATEARRTASEAAEVATEAAEAADDPDAAPPPESLAMGMDAGGDSPPAITAVERKVLEAMTTRTFRTRLGIAEDAGVSRNRISEMLQSLHERKLAAPAKSPQTGGNRWVITELGRAALGA